MAFEFIKIQNFKSYKSSVFFGPLYSFSCITGKNGSGKTNLSDSLLFVLGANLEEINCHSIQNLFSDNMLFETKIGLRINNKNKKNDFIRAISNDNSSEFFYNGIKVSLKNYKKSLEYINFYEFKNFIILKNILQNNFLSKDNKLSEIMDKLSGSKNFSIVQIKLGLLIKKFQKNAFFFFQKLKFILNERVKLIQIQAKILQIKENKKNYKLIEKNECLFKIINLMYKLFRLYKKKKKKKRKEKELYLQHFIIFSFYTCLEKIFKNIQLNIITLQKFFIIITSTLRFFKFFYLNLEKIKKWSLQTIYLIIFDTELSKFSKKKILEKNYFREKKILLKNSKNFQFYLKFFSINFKKKKFIQKNKFEKKLFFPFETTTLKNLNYFEIPEKKPFFFFHFNICNKKKNWFFIKSEKILFILKKIKLNINSFFRNVLFFFILLEIKKNKKKNENIREKFSQEKFYLYLKNLFPGIRCKSSELFKPLDSKFKKFANIKLGYNKSSIIVDNFRTAFDCFILLQKKKKVGLNFISNKDLLNTSFKKSIAKAKNFNNLISFFDFDSYDSNIIYFIFESTLFSITPNQSEEKNSSNTFQNFYLPSGVLVEKNQLFTISYNFDKVKKEKNFFHNESLKKKKLSLLEIFTRIIIRKKKIQNFFLLNIEFRKKKKKLIYEKKLILKELKKINFLDKFCVKIWGGKNIKQINIVNYFQLFFNFYKNKLFKIFLKILKKKFNQHFPCVFEINKKNNQIEKIAKFHTIFHQNFSKTLRVKKKNEKLSIYKKNMLICFFLKKFNELFFYSLINFKFFKKFLKIYEKISKKKIILKKLVENEKKKFIEILYRQNYFKILFKKNFFYGKKFQKDSLKNLKIFLNKKYFIFLITKFLFPSQFFKKKNFISNKNKIFNFYHFCLFHNYKKIFRKNIREKIFEKRSSFKKKEKELINNENFQKKLFLIDERKKLLKKKLIQTRHYFLIANSKYFRIVKERQERFKFYCEKVSEQVNIIYKNITKNFLNPNGGTAFLSIENDKNPFLGKVFYTVAPPSKALQQTHELSGGERIIAIIALILSFSIINKQPFILFDEIDSSLDFWHTEKLFFLLKNLSKKNNMQICIITLKIKFLIFFKILFCLFKNKTGTNLFVINIKY
jgi:hypothetical protein